MDLLYALDDRFQAGVAEPASIAPVARLFGVDTVWATGDAAFDRFRTPRPELVHDLFASGVAGLGDPVAYGGSVINEPDIAMVDEQSVSDPRIGRPIPPVELVAVDDPVPIVRAKDDVVVVAGNGDGVIDAAAAGLLDGTELIRYAGSLGPELDTDGTVDQIIVTDTNRARAHHWRGSQDVVGLTEDDDPRSPDVLRSDPADERLALFPDPASATTVAVQEGPVRARASAYGEPFAYRPEDRAAMAIDGDPDTAWRVADRAPAEGEHLRLDIDDPIDHLVLRQPAGAARGRHIGTVTIEVDDEAPIAVTLDDRSLGPDGQRIDIAPTLGASTVTITIDSVVVPDPQDIGPALAAVGFAEVDAGVGPTVEVVQPPAVPDVEGVPRSYVFSRLRTRPSDRWRSDPEPTMVRRFAVPRAIESSPEVTVRLDQRASDEVLAGLLGIRRPGGDGALDGCGGRRGMGRHRRRPGHGVDHTVLVRDRRPLAAHGRDALDGAGARAAEWRLLADPAAAGHVELGRRRRAGSSGRRQRVQPCAAAGHDHRAGHDRDHRDRAARGRRPALRRTGRRPGRHRRAHRHGPDRGADAARHGMPRRPRRARWHAVAAARRRPGRRSPRRRRRLSPSPANPPSSPSSAAPTCCGVTRGPGCRSTASPSPTVRSRRHSTAGPTTVVQSQERLSRTVRVEDCPAGCWLVLGEGYNESWSAQLVDGTDLGSPQLVDGGFNGWWIAPGEGATTVELRWDAQRPVTTALVLTIGAVLACIALAVGDRRRAPPPRRTAARWVGLGRLEPRRTCLVAAAAWIVGSVLLIGPEWALPAAVGAAVIVLVRRPRLAAVAAMAMIAIIGMVIVAVVIHERPLPNAGWPARFEWLHGWGLFAAVALAVSSFGRDADRRPDDLRGQRPGDRGRALLGHDSSGNLECVARQRCVRLRDRRDADRRRRRRTDGGRAGRDSGPLVLAARGVPRRPASDRRHRRPAVPRRAPRGWLPRRRPVLRLVGLPHHVAAGTRRRSSGIRLAAFYGRRFRRLLPAVYALIVAAAVWTWASGRRPWSTASGATACGPWPTSPTGTSSPIPAPTGRRSPSPRCSITSGAWRSRSSSTSCGRSSSSACGRGPGAPSGPCSSCASPAWSHRWSRWWCFTRAAIRRGCTWARTPGRRPCSSAPLPPRGRAGGSSPPSWFGSAGAPRHCWPLSVPWCSGRGSPPTGPARRSCTAAGCCSTRRPARWSSPSSSRHRPRPERASFGGRRWSGSGRCRTGCTSGTGRSTCSFHPSGPTSTASR